MKRLAGARELLDGNLDPDALAGNLRDLGRLNSWLGGAALSWRALRGVLHAGAGRATLLDVGTGGGDIALYLARTSRRASLSLDVTATDVRPEIVAVAARTLGSAGVSVKLARPEGLDEPDRAYDVIHSSLVLHHFEPAEAAHMLREMARVARRAVIVNDLDRARRWHWLARALGAVTTRNRYTRHDGPLSVLRAYRPAELGELAAGAGLREEARYWTRPAAYRYAVVFRKE